MYRLCTCDLQGFVIKSGLDPIPLELYSKALKEHFYVKEGKTLPRINCDSYKEGWLKLTKLQFKIWLVLREKIGWECAYNYLMPHFVININY